MADISWVTPQIAISSEPSASWVPGMVRAGITDVLDLRGEPRANEQPEPELYAGTSIRYYYDPMLDRGGPESESAYVEGVGVIRQALANGGKILVHCAAGISRSPSMVYAYLRSTGMSAADAWSMIHTARPVASQQYFSSAERALDAIGKSQPVSGGITFETVLIGAAVGIGMWFVVRKL